MSYHTTTRVGYINSTVARQLTLLKHLENRKYNEKRWKKIFMDKWYRGVPFDTINTRPWLRNKNGYLLNNIKNDTVQNTT